MEPPTYLSYAEAAEYLRVPVGTLYSWVSTKRVPHTRLSSRMVRFKREDLDRWLAEREVEPQGGDH